MASHKQFLLSVVVAMMCQHVFCARKRQSQRQPMLWEGVTGDPDQPTTEPTAAPTDAPEDAPTSEEPKLVPTTEMSCGSRHYTSADGKTFIVGEGAGIEYKPNYGEYLKKCETKAVADGSCNGPLTLPNHQLTKVSKSGKYKLCCKVRKCTWRPKANKFEPMTNYDKTQLAPLTPFTKKYVHGNTCLCCKVNNVMWTSDVNEKCMLAYKPGRTGVTGWAFGAALTFGASDLLWKQGCNNYCKNFPEYPVAKKSILKHSWK